MTRRRSVPAPLLLAVALALAALARTPRAWAQREPDAVVRLAVLPDPYENEERRRVIVAANLGTLDRGTSGTRVGYGYDATMSTLAGLDLRVVGPMGICERCLTHGFAVGYTYSAGPTFGVHYDAAFRLHLVDLAYVARVEFPCMRRQHRRVHLSGMLGAAGLYADAGLGDVPRDLPDDANERATVAARYDHAALGWRVGTSLDVTFDGALVGVGVDLREVYGIGTTLARTFIASAVLRVGFDVGWTRRRVVPQYAQARRLRAL